MFVYRFLDNEQLFEQLDFNLINGRPPRSLYVSQIVLTPSWRTLVANVDSTLDRWEMATMNKSLEWLNVHHASGQHGLNIVIRDFVDEDFTRRGIRSLFLTANLTVSSR